MQLALFEPPKPDLRHFDMILINSSAGKDSQTMLRYVTRQADRDGVADRIVVVHADLGRVEWPGCPELAEEQTDRYGHRFEIVKRSQGDLLDHIEKRGMFPSPKQRYCTSDHKRSQVQRLITALGRDVLTEGKETARILNCLGMRAEESPARKKMPMFQFNAAASTKLLPGGQRRREVWNWLPIHEWTLGEIWDDIKASGVPYHRAYDLGMPRLSCCFCIFAPLAALLIAGQHNPDLLTEYVRVEKQIDHRFRQDLSLESVQQMVQESTDIDLAELAEEWNT